MVPTVNPPRTARPALPSGPVSENKRDRPSAPLQPVRRAREVFTFLPGINGVLPTRPQRRFFAPLRRVARRLEYMNTATPAPLADWHGSHTAAVEPRKLQSRGCALIGGRTAGCRYCEVLESYSVYTVFC